MRGTDAALMAPAVSGGPSRAFKAGALVMLASFVIFSGAELFLLGQSPLFAGAVSPGGVPVGAYLLGGQWIAMTLSDLMRPLPGGIPGATNFLMLTIAASLLGWFASTLVRRGWTPAQTALAAALIALNPVVLLMVTSKSAPLLAVLTAGATVLSLDRIEAIGDTQATIVFGMAFACMFAVWPDALYFGGILLFALPLANPEVRSLSAAVAAFFIACVPAMILVASFFLGAGWFGVSAAQLIRVWQAPLHGGATSAVAASAWLGRFGGQFWRPWAATVLLCLAAMPPMLVIPLRLMTRRRTRARPVTGVVALRAPSLAGALMTLFWHIASPMMPLALSIGITSVWAVTAQLRAYERRLWIAFALCGAVIGWSTPFLWQNADTQAWRSAMIGAMGK